MSADVFYLPTAHAAPAPGGPGTVSSVELVIRTGISYRQLDYWTRTGRLIPDVACPGSGASRHFPTSEVPVAALMRRLIDAGVSVEAAHDLSRDLVEYGRAELAGFELHLPIEP